ncbi:receptor-type tyrosine-protein phosphatase H-like [Dermacentor albipictus]|uniref:receptor-type tyrosine-protein phosphatase H-like n=1 Tax=Dermacentor albipictus TaxID=60249 RepID=UPI0031FD6B7C
MMGRIPTRRRTLPVASLAWTGLYAFLWCSALAIAQSSDTCPELPELNVTRNGSNIILHRAKPLPSIPAKDSSCICYPVLDDEQDLGITCENATLSNVTCDTTPVDQDGKIEIEIDNEISSGQASICHISNCGKKNCSIYDASNDIASVSDLNITFVNSSMAFVSWSVHQHYGPGASQFHVTWCAEETNCSSDTTCLEDGRLTSDQNVTDTSAVIEELSPATSLRLRVAPLGVRGNSSFGCIEIPPEEPERIENITASLHGLDGLQVQWARQASLNISYDHYELRYCVNKDAICPEYKERYLNECSSVVSEIELNRSSYDIPSLKPKSVVVVGVASKRRYPNGMVTKSEETVHCFESPAPGIITDLNARDITSRNATVLWTFEQDGYEELRPASFNVTWCVTTKHQCPSNASVCTEDSQTTVRTKTAALNTSSLAPWSAILVTVEALYTNGSEEVSLGEPAAYCFQTLAEAPGKPRDLRITTVETTSAVIEWREPAVKNGALDGYILNVCGVNDSVGNNCTESTSLQVMINDSLTPSHTLRGLDPWTKYTVSLAAFNRDVDGSEMISDASTEVFHTDAVAPGSVTSLSVVDVTNRSISLSWSKPDFRGGNVHHYEVTHCTVDNCDTTAEVSSGLDTESSDCHTLQEKAEETQLTNLQPWKFVAIRVAAVNIMKNDSRLLGEAATICQRTRRGVPGRPEDVRTIANKESIQIRWERPLVPNGDVSQYKVDVCSEDENNETKCETRTVLGGETHTLIKHLVPWTVYSVSVAAQNIEETTVLESESVRTTVKTLAAAPSKPMNLKSTELHHSVNISWDEPELKRGPLHGYNVSWIIEDWLGRMTSAGSMVTNDTAVQLSTWKPYSNYTLSVRAFHQIEDGEPLYGDAALMAFKTAVDAPDQAKLDTVIGSRSAAISMSVHGSPNGPLDGFLWCNYAISKDSRAHNEMGGPSVCSEESRTTQRLLLLEGLKPWAFYKFTARAYNLDKTGSPLEGKETWTFYRTNPDAPLFPGNFSVARFESRRLYVNWSEPVEKNGELDGYVLSWNLSADGLEVNHTDLGSRSTVIPWLEPFTEYTLQLRAYNLFGPKRLEGPAVRILARTLSEAPGPVVGLEAKAFKNNTVHLTWRPPIQPRGELRSYVVIYNATKPGKPAIMNVPSDFLTASSTCHGRPAVCTFEVEELPAEYVYTFDVRGINVNVSAWGDALESPVQVEVPAGDPPPPKNMSMVASDCPSAPEPDTQKSFLISRNMFDERNGEIRRYAVVVGSAELIHEDVENTTTWKDLARNHRTPPHVVTPQDWNPFSKAKDDDDPLNCEPLRGREGTLICTIGYESCDDDRETPCNGPLRGGTEYAMYVIGYTKGGRRASIPEVFVTALPEEPSSAGAIAGGILTAIIIMAAILVVLVIHRRRLARQKQASSKRPSAEASNMNNSLVHLVQMSDVNGSTTKPNPTLMQDEIEMEHHVIKDINKPIPNAEFRDHLAMMTQDSAYRFADEYERLVELSPQYPSDVARHPANSKKNRFTNIHPFDKSRVPLSVVGDDEQSSYINASFVKGCNADREYIAAQGPNALTINDFWRMIWEHDVKIIIMLTQFIEGNKKKCEKYWPDDNKEHAYGSVQVRKDSTVEREDFILTEFRIKSDDSSKWRSLRHVFFTAWKDHGTPEKPDTLIQFVRTCQSMFGPRGGSQPPILVHCSAGVGRTGTFIALDMCLQKLQVEDEIDIFHLVLDLRECRRCMVQNEKQYTYLYHCVAAVIDEMCGYTVQNEPIYENVAALMSGPTC